MYARSISLRLYFLTVFEDTKKIDEKDEKIIRGCIHLSYLVTPLIHICSSGRERYSNSQDVCTCEVACSLWVLFNLSARVKVPTQLS